MAQNNKYKYLIKNTGILTLSQFSSKILVFFLVPLYTSVLSTAEYGLYDVVATTISLLYPILSANIATAVLRYLMDKTYDRSKIAFVGLKFTCIGAFVGSGIFILARFVGAFQVLEGFEWIICLLYTFTLLDQYLIQYSKGIEKLKEMGIAGVLGTFSTIAFNIVFLLVINIGLKGFFLASLLGQVMPVIYLSFSVNPFKTLPSRLYSEDDILQLQKEMLRYSLPLIVSTIAWWVNSAADRYAVTWLIGASANGLLSVAYKIPTILNTIQSIFTQSWQISAIKEYSNEDSNSFFSTIFTITNAVLCISASGIIILTKPLAHFLFSNDFYYAWQYVPLLLIASVINGGSGIIGPILSAKKDSKSIAVAGTVGAIVNIGLNIILVLAIGIQGATIATVISSIVIYFIRRRKIESEEFGLSKKSEMLIYSSWALCCCQAIIEVYLETPDILSYAFELLIVFLIYLIYRDTLITMFNKAIKSIGSRLSK